MIRRLYAFLRSLAIYYGRPGRMEHLKRHYATWVSPDGTAFDIGAHVGNRTRAFAALGARVVAVEPQTELARFLRRAFSRNPRVTVVEAALGAEEAEVELFLSPGNLTVATTSPEWAEHAADHPGWEQVTFTARRTVRQSTLDYLIHHYGEPDFVKIDVENSEDEVLAGLSRPVRAISVEFLPAQRDVAFHAILRLEHLAADAGRRYRYNFSLGETLTLVMRDRWWSFDELNNYLREIPADGPSGDIYAELVPIQESGDGEDG